MRFPLSIAIVLTSATLAATPVLAAQCVNVTIKDDKGAVAQTAIGFMLDGTAMIGLSIPPQYSRVVGDQVPCPQDLVNRFQGLFNESCLTEERRNKAAAQSKGPIDTINKRCADMARALRDNPKP